MVTVELRALSVVLGWAVTVIFTVPALPLVGCTLNQVEALVSATSALQAAVVENFTVWLWADVPACMLIPCEKTAWLSEGISILGVTGVGGVGSSFFLSQANANNKAPDANRRVLSLIGRYNMGLNCCRNPSLFKY